MARLFLFCIVINVNKFNSKIIKGDRIGVVDNDLRTRSAVVSNEFTDTWKKTHDKVIGSYVNLKGYNYKIVGEFKANQLVNLFQDTTDIYVPKSAYQHVELYNKGDGVLVTMKKDADSHSVLKTVAKNLRTKGSVKYRGSYHIQDNAQAASAVGQILKGITAFVSLIAAISLFIAGIGVMNMTYISVAERMPEIGIRRAIGARSKDVIFQFLVEGTMLTTIGGIVGYFGGSSLAMLIGLALPFKVSFEPSSFWLAFLVSFAIGLIFSVGPARTATKKNLVELMR